VKTDRSKCPIAGSLEIFGDRWTLVVVRDLAIRDGKARFGDFLKSPERIPTNVLTARLAGLEANGVVVKRAYQTHPPRFEYALTRKGAELLPVLQAICVWAKAHVPESWPTPEKFLALTPSDLTNDPPEQRARPASAPE
jgi:DNA-binding HxlR family transcriptional regulator